MALRFGAFISECSAFDAKSLRRNPTEEVLNFFEKATNAISAKL
jgi:hypothetical protein